MRLRKRVLVPAGSVLVGILVATVIGEYYLQQQHSTEQARERLANVKAAFQEGLDRDAETMAGLIAWIENDNRLQESWLARDRETLLRRVEPIFEKIRADHSVTHLYFHQPDRVNFLRVHNPPHHGDYIDRFTMDGAVRKEELVYGIELGPFGTFALRVVSPWRIDGVLVGYIELGEEIEHITLRLQGLLGVELFFTIDKQYLDREKWEEGLNMLGRTGNWEEIPARVVIDRTLPAFPAKLRECLDQPHQEHAGILIEAFAEDREFQGMFAPLIDAGGRDVGDIVALVDFTADRSRLRSFILCVTTGGVLLGVVLCWFFWLHLGRIEKNLRDSVEWHRVLFESSRDAIMTLAPPSWKFTSGNPATLEMFGARDEAEFVALGPWDLSPEFQPDGRPSDEKAAEMIEKAMKEGTHSFEWQHKRFQGEEFPASVLLTWVELGDQLFLQGTVRDISEQKQAEQALRESEQRFMDVLYAADDAILLIDGEKFVDCNEATARMLEYANRDDFLMTHPSELSPPEQPDGRDSFEKAGDMIRTAFEKGFHRFEWIHRKADGKDFPVEVSLTPINYQGKTILHCLWRDLTEQKRSEEELARSLCELEAFNRAMTGRETRIIEIKQEVNALSAELGRQPAYNENVDEEETLTPVEAAPEDKPREVPALTEHPVADNPTLEKRELDVAYIPIICSAPLLYAASHGYFAKHGLKVELTPASGWSGVKDLMAYGQVDAAHMLSPMPLACSLGIDGRRADIRLAAVQNVNGQALALSKRHEGIRDVRDMKGMTFGVPYHFSMHYYLLCTFLAEHGVNPLKDVTIKEVAPPRMPYYLEKGWVDGVFAPEPFNQIPVHRGTGFIHTLSKEIWNGHPCCSFAMGQDFIDRHPNTYRAMLQSVLEAELALHRASPDERRAVAAELAAPGFLNIPDDVEPIQDALSGEYPDGLGNDRVDHDRIDFVPHPWPDYATWMLTQMQRWNQLRRQVDYREIAEGVLVGETRELAEALGFERQHGPRLRKGSPRQADDPFEAMRAQPFSAFHETEDTGDAPPASDDERMQRLMEWAARFSGGKPLGELPAWGDGPIGHLAAILRDIHTNMHYAKQAMEEQIDKQEKQVADRTAELHTGRQAALNLLEDANRAKEQLDQHVAALESANAALEESNEAVEAANRTKSEFLANMSHEIRTPMTAILGFTDILLNDLKEPEALDAAQIVKRNGEHLLQIINDILDVSKIEAGKVEMEMIRWSPRQVVAEVVSLLHVRADARGLTLADEYVGPLPETITTDPTRLRQILVNLVGNSVKFTEAGGVRIVTHLVEAPDGESKLRFDVIDTGVGIPEEQIDKVFNAFVQADGSVTRDFGGTGLGLAISRQLARLLGGDVTAISEPGRGSTFSLTVAAGPLDGVRLVEYLTEAAPASEQPVESTDEPQEKLQCRVLLAEDIPDNQRLVSSILSESGAEVTIAQDGQEAVEKAMAACPGWGNRYSDPTEPFDVILMDVQMPVLDGHEATRRLRKEGYTRPIIALTAHAMRGDRQKCLDAGCDDYLTKPVDRKKLLETVARWVSKHHKQPEVAAASECGSEEIKGVMKQAPSPPGQQT